MSSLICRKCNDGFYFYSKDERSDFENRIMVCNNCGFEDTLKEFIDFYNKHTYDCGDIILSNNCVFGFFIHPILNKYMWRKLKKDSEPLWFNKEEVEIEEKLGNIFDKNFKVEGDKWVLT